MKEKFIPKHGGYKKLLSFQKAEIIYDATVYFTKKYLKNTRTIDQMIQAARSGKQNIVEGSMGSGTSKEIELRLTGVAKASLEELLHDYRDFLRFKKLKEWRKDHAYALRLRELIRTEDANYETFRKGIEHNDTWICVNVIIGLIKVTTYLLARQLESLEEEFLLMGGIKERMFHARRKARDENRF